MVRATIDAGVCGFTTRLTAECDDGQRVRFHIESDCENIGDLAGELSEVDAYHEIGAGFDGALFTTVRARMRGCCAGCIVPCGIFKSMQVAAGLALPAPASIAMERTN